MAVICLPALPSLAGGPSGWWAQCVSGVGSQSFLLYVVCFIVEEMCQQFLRSSHLLGGLQFEPLRSIWPQSLGTFPIWAKVPLVPLMRGMTWTITVCLSDAKKLLAGIWMLGSVPSMGHFYEDPNFFHLEQLHVTSGGGWDSPWNPFRTLLVAES